MRTLSISRIGLTLVSAMLVVPCAVADAATGGTVLASRTPSGGFPNGPSAHAAFSQDRTGASLLAFDSVASDLTAGDSNGFGDVFVVHRAKPFKAGARKATRWKPGATELVSTGMGGAPADGASFLPDLDGDQLHGTHCVAFLSDATNLVPGDTNAKTDAFVKDLSSGRITRVSVSSSGEQADGASYDVQVDGACDRVAFTSDASNLALLRSQVPKPTVVDSPLTGSQRRRCRARTPKKPCKTRKLRVKSRRAPAATSAPPAGTKQVYVRVLGGQGDDDGLVGLTFLASASRSGEAGNADSFDAALGDLGAGCPKACGTTSGDAVAFTSLASNLRGGDGNGVSDVYQRSFRIPSQTFLDRRAKIPSYMHPLTRLVSGTKAGRAGNGASDQPATNGASNFVAFRTAATDLVPDGNGVTDVVRADMEKTPPALLSMSFTARGDRKGNGASSDPALSRSGTPGLFLTEATNLTAVPSADKNCVADVVSWSARNRRLAVQSLDSDGRISGNAGNPRADPCPSPATSPATRPASSWYANYAAFEDGNPLLDLPTADRVFPGLRNDPAQAATRANSEPGLHQIYVRFVAG
jgi:hypothetical protein